MRGLYSCLALGLAGAAGRAASMGADASEAEYDYIQNDTDYLYDEDDSYDGYNLGYDNEDEAYDNADEAYDNANKDFQDNYITFGADETVYQDFLPGSDENGVDYDAIAEDDDEYLDNIAIATTEAPYIPPYEEPRTEAPYIQPDRPFVAPEVPEYVPPVRPDPVLPERPTVVVEDDDDQVAQAWRIPSDLISRYYGSRPSKKSFNQLLDLNCQSFINTMYKIHSDMSIDSRSGLQVANNVRQVKTAFDGFMLKIYKSFDCTDMVVLELFEEFYGEIDFLINPHGRNPEGGYFSYNDFAFGKVQKTQALFCDLLNKMDRDVKYEFENAWREMIYQMEDPLI